MSDSPSQEEEEKIEKIRSEHMRILVECDECYSVFAQVDDYSRDMECKVCGGESLTLIGDNIASLVAQLGASEQRLEESRAITEDL